MKQGNGKKKWGQKKGQATNTHNGEEEEYQKKKKRAAERWHDCKKNGVIKRILAF